MTAKNKIIIDLHLLGVMPKDFVVRLRMAKRTVYDNLSKFKKSLSSHFLVSSQYYHIVRKPGSVKTKTVRTSRLIRAVKGSIQCNPVRSMRKMAKELSRSENTNRNVVKYDLKAKSRAKSKRHLITEEFKAKQVERSKKLLSIHKKGQPIILFSDEKCFTVDSVSNNRTDP